MKSEDIHIGFLIKQKVQERGLTISAFAQLIHCSRANVHSLFRRKSVDVDFLVRISSSLDFDFLAYYDETKKDSYIVVIESSKDFLEKLLREDSVKVLGFHKT